LATFHENKLASELDVLMEMIEPALVIIMGLIVGGMVIALYLPLFKLGELRDLAILFFYHWYFHLRLR
jgi:type IV pilus assembly protein PilC